MSAKNQRWHISLLILLTCAAFMPILSCRSTPPPQYDEPPSVALAAEPVQQPVLGQPDLDRLDTAMARATGAREDALAVRAPTHFPDEWAQAESNYEAGRGAGRASLEAVNQAVASFTTAADLYEAMAANSAPLFARDLDDAQRALAAAITRAQRSRQDALDNEGPTHFARDWRNAEAGFQRGENMERETLEGVEAATTLYLSAADDFDRIAERSRPLMAQARENAQRDMQAALSQAEQSRRLAQANRANAHFPAEWREAEAQLRVGRVRRGATPDEMRTATAVLTSVAASYDDLAERSRPLFERDEAQRVLNAAITRADRSRRAAMNANGHNFFPNDWRNAEAQNQAGVNAPRNTASEVQAATAFFVSAADRYDDITQRSGSLLARERDNANDALQAAMARTRDSRQAAMDAEGQVHFPSEWRAAEAQNTAATRARRNTLDETRAATALFATAADSYDDITRRSGTMAAAARDEANREFQAAVSRVDGSRRAAVNAEGQSRFPNDWNRAESQNTAGRGAPRSTANEIRAATAQLNSAADGFDNIAQRATVARERDEANNALQAAIARADSSRQAAVDIEGQLHFPDDWRNAEAQNTAARRARRNTPDEMRAATTLFATAADSYDDIARRSRPIAAAARNEANRDFQAAVTRADRSRRAASDVDGQTHFPNDWNRAESQNTAGRNAPRNTVTETRAAIAQLNSAADGFDNIAQRSGEVFARAREEANSALQAAIARADSSRQAAVAAEAQTFLPAEWRAAESQNTAARRARRNTTDEMRAATTLFAELANSYDDLARRSAPMLAAERNEANRALQAAVARATQSRQQAENADVATNLPREWRNLETRHSNAENARRETLTEIRNTTNLFVGVANAFDDLIQRNIRIVEQNEAAAQVARAAAERERQAALDARANVAASEDFDRADATFQQALRDFNARNFTAARTQYTQSANQFVASVRETERRRRLADVAVEQARQRSAQSTAHAISVGLAMEEDSDT